MNVLSLQRLKPRVDTGNGAAGVAAEGSCTSSWSTCCN